MKNQNYTTTLISSVINTPLGSIVALADQQYLYFLGFIDRTNIEKEIEHIRSQHNATIISGTSAPIESIKVELAAYFNGTLREFKTPLHIIGTSFQKSCWNALQKIPYGHTISYAEQAHAINNKNALRAVGNANKTNKFSIIIPCHRIITSSGKLGGYNGGINRKQWLLDLEKQYSAT